MTVEQSLERKFGGFPLPIVGGRALELTVVSPYKECQPSELTIDSATALVLEQQTHHSTERIDTFPCTRNEWHKHIFWPVHANGGDHSHLQYGVVNFAPYSPLAIKMRLPKHTTSLTHSRGSRKLDATFQPPLYHGYDILTTELCNKLNKLELRTAPPVPLRLQYSPPSL